MAFNLLQFRLLVSTGPWDVQASESSSKARQEQPCSPGPAHMTKDCWNRIPPIREFTTIEISSSHGSGGTVPRSRCQQAVQTLEAVPSSSLQLLGLLMFLGVGAAGVQSLPPSSGPSSSFFFFFFFLGPYPWHMEVPGLGVESKLQLPASTTATATPDPKPIEQGQESNPCPQGY